MKDLQKLYQECIDELAGLGIRPAAIDRVVPNTRAKQRWGLARQLPAERKWARRHWEISINAILLEDRLPDDAAKTVLMHEILHCVPGCQGHKGKWRELADLVERELGYHIRRTNRPEDFGLPSDGTREYRLPGEGGDWSSGFVMEAGEDGQLRIVAKEDGPTYPYLVKCEGCGQFIGRERLSKLIKSPHLYRCTKCGGRFVRVR